VKGFQRRYVYGGTVAHLLPNWVDLSRHPYEAALCVFSPQWPGAWLGSGSQNEEETAATLPICKRCLATLDEPKEESTS
jgi:hypothetical protein